MNCLSCGRKRKLSEWGDYGCGNCGFPWELSTALTHHILEQSNFANVKNQNIERCIMILSHQLQTTTQGKCSS